MKGTVVCPHRDFYVIISFLFLSVERPVYINQCINTKGAIRESPLEWKAFVSVYIFMYRVCVHIHYYSWKKVWRCFSVLFPRPGSPSGKSCCTFGADTRQPPDSYAPCTRNNPLYHDIMQSPSHNQLQRRPLLYVLMNSFFPAKHVLYINSTTHYVRLFSYRWVKSSFLENHIFRSESSPGMYHRATSKRWRSHTHTLTRSHTHHKSLSYREFPPPPPVPIINIPTSDLICGQHFVKSSKG